MDLPATYDGDLARAVNRQTAPALVVLSAVPAPDGFDARRSATSRRYRYLVWNAPVPDPLRASLAWHVAEPLDLRSMAAAADPLIGEHDFRAFCRRAPGTDPSDPIVRRVLATSWRRVPVDDSEAPAEASPGSLLRFDVVATSFCHQMVRSIVAALVDAGRGRSNAAKMMAVLASASRVGAPQPAPAHGLCLVDVSYDGAGDECAGDECAGYEEASAQEASAQEARRALPVSGDGLPGGRSSD